MDKQVLEFKCVTDIDEAEKIWRRFSPEETLYDAWEFRALFQKYHQKEIRFYCGYLAGELIGCLPLQYNAEKGWLEFFGGDYMEDNRLFLKDGFEEYRPNFYEYVKTLGETIHLECIRGEDAFTSALELQDYKYVLPIEKYQSHEEYVADVFSSETKKTLLKKMRRVERLGVEITKNKFEDIEKLFEFNIAMFGDHSSFSDRPFHKEIFRELLNLSPKFTTHLLSFSVAGVLTAVSISIEYRGIYAYILLGSDPNGVKDMATYINLQNIQNAIPAKAKFVDCFVGAYGWKDRWHFTPIPQYKYFFGIAG